MGLFGNDDKDRLKVLFASGDLDEIVWREEVAQFANGAAFVDVVVSSPKPALLQDIRKVGLTYWPNGPVVRGVQNYTVGSSVTFAMVPVKAGGQLALAASTNWGDSLPARVDVVPAGSGARTEGERRGQSGLSPLEILLRDSGMVLALAVGIAAVYVFVRVAK